MRALAILLVLPSLAWAYHPGKVFDDEPGAGGGGGIFYAGAPREHAWTCAACHIDAPGKVKLSLAANPSSLLDEFRYTPGQKYMLTAQMVTAQELGTSATNSNYNGLVIEIVDEKGLPAGALSGFSSNEFYSASSPTTIATAGQTTAETSWTFTWTAPAAGSGQVTIYAGLVDGNGANSGPGETLTDPFGDDVFAGALKLSEGSGARRETRPPRWIFALLFLPLLAIRRRRDQPQ
jgi:hypothetical protein